MNDEVLNGPHRVDKTTLLFVLIDNIGYPIRSPRRNEVALSVQGFNDRVFLVKIIGLLILVSMLNIDALGRHMGFNGIRKGEALTIFIEVRKPFFLKRIENKLGIMVANDVNDVLAWHRDEALECFQNSLVGPHNHA